MKILWRLSYSILLAALFIFLTGPRAFATSVNCEAAFKTAGELDTSPAEVMAKRTADENMARFHVDFPPEKKQWIYETQILVDRLSRHPLMELEQLQTPIGDLEIIRTEIQIFQKQIELRLQQMGIAVDGDAGVDSAPAEFHNAILSLRQIHQKLVQSLESGQLTYLHYLEISSWMGIEFYELGLKPRGAIRTMEELIWSISRSSKANGTLVLPTSQELPIEMMNIFSSQRVGFIGVIFSPKWVDARRLTPPMFFSHDMAHLHAARVYIGDSELAEKIFRNAPPDEMRMRHLIWFAYWHELGPVLGVNNEILEPIHGFTLADFVHFRDRDMSLLKLNSKMGDSTDLGADLSLRADFALHFQSTLAHLAAEFP